MVQLTERDFQEGNILYEREMIRPLTLTNMFRAGIYCILSATEVYWKQLSLCYQLIIGEGKGSPERIINDRETLEKVVSKARFPKAKINYIYEFSLWWESSELPLRMIDDVNGTKEKEIELRDQIANEAPGLGPKCASMLMNMCGYERVVPIDIWMARFLKGLGHEIHVPDYLTNGGYSLSQHKRFEEVFWKVTESYGRTPAECQRALWCKLSSWNQTALQLELFPSLAVHDLYEK